MGAASAMNPVANASGQPELSERKAAVLNDARRTIAVTAPRRSRFSRLRVVYPDHAPQPAYDVTLARELLGRTGEIPHSKRGLVVVLTEYRHALHALAQQAYAARRTTEGKTTREIIRCLFSGAPGAEGSGLCMYSQLSG